MDNIISFKDENGNDLKYEILGIELYNGKVYCVCYPTDGTTEAYIYRIEQSDNEEFDEYIFEENHEIAKKVFEQFKKRSNNK